MSEKLVEQTDNKSETSEGQAQDSLKDKEKPDDQKSEDRTTTTTTAASTLSEEKKPDTPTTHAPANAKISTKLTIKKRKDDPARFDGIGMDFKAKLIGIQEVAEPRGDQVCQAAMFALKGMIRVTGQHKQRIILNISTEGLKLMDEKNENTLYTFPVSKISFIARDPSDNRAFGFIFASPDGRNKFYGVKTASTADQAVLSIRDMFHIVYERKKQEIEAAKEAGEDTNVDQNMNQMSEGDGGGATGVADLLDLQSELDTLKEATNQIDDAMKPGANISQQSLLDMEPDSPQTPSEASVSPTKEPNKPTIGGQDLAELFQSSGSTQSSVLVTNCGFLESSGTTTTTNSSSANNPFNDGFLYSVGSTNTTSSVSGAGPQMPDYTLLGQLDQRKAMEEEHERWMKQREQQLQQMHQQTTQMGAQFVPGWGASPSLEVPSQKVMVSTPLSNNPFMQQQQTTPAAGIQATPIRPLDSNNMSLHSICTTAASSVFTPGNALSPLQDSQDPLNVAFTTSYDSSMVRDRPRPFVSTTSPATDLFSDDPSAMWRKKHKSVENLDEAFSKLVNMDEILSAPPAPPPAVTRAATPPVNLGQSIYEPKPDDQFAFMRAVKPTVGQLQRVSSRPDTPTSSGAQPPTVPPRRSGETSNPFGDDFFK